MELGRKPSASPAAGGRDEIEGVSIDGRESATPDSARKHIRGLAEGAKFESGRESSIGLAENAKAGEPEDAEAAKLQRANRGRLRSQKRCTETMRSARKLQAAWDG